MPASQAIPDYHEPRARNPVVRVLIIWAIHAVALVIMSLIMRRVEIDTFGTAIIAAAVIGLFNALLWPILSYVLVPFVVITLGLAALVMNGLMVWWASRLVEGFYVEDFGAAFWLALGMAAINIIFSTILTIDDDGSWYRSQVKRRMKRIAKPEPTDVPGILFLEVDGLAKPILEQALAEGYAPTLKRWIDSGSHRVLGWETDTSSQTSASQAGILHGNNSNIPAFRWYDKAEGRIVASSNAKILPEIEGRLSDGDGLLAGGGASRGNLLSGDAEHVLATASTIHDRSKFHTSEFQAYFANPYNMSRTLLLFFWDVILEIRQFRKARRDGVQPILDKHHRGGVYPFIRAATTIFIRELNIYTLLGDVFAGRPVAYATFVGYDEIAHHSGILDPGAFDALRKLDEQFARLESAVREAPRPYHFVILSDHGQTGGATFQQRYGQSLQDLVQSLMAADTPVGGDLTGDEGIVSLNLFLTDTIQNEQSGATKVVARALKSKTVDGEVVLTDESEAEALAAQETAADGEAPPPVYVLASGNLGLISFTAWPERMTLEEINTAFPALVSGLLAHPGIGFLMVRSESQGPIVLGAKGIYHLRDDRVEGENPLAVFGKNAARHLRRTDSFPNCPDILVNSFYDPEKNEGAAFEELIGFHGGLGGTQTQPFILFPASLPAPEGEIIGAAEVYRICKGWLRQLHGGPDELAASAAMATEAEAAGASSS